MRLLILLFSAHVFATPAPAPLPSLHIDRGAISISGISSGAFMAVQMQVAFSRTFAGSASIAGGTYWCAKGDLNRAQSVCQNSPDQIQTADSVNEAQLLASQNAIDPLNGLSGKPVYVYASPSDSIINPGNSDKLMEFLKTFGARITFVNSVNSAHGFPTLDHGVPCQFPMLPWILNCNYDAAGEILKALYGSLQSRGKADPAHLHKFAQTDFGDAKTPLFPEGWIYVPEACAKGAKCKLHMALHGCQMNPEFIQDQFARNSGFNEWAESNAIVVIYPQSAKLGDANPYACWDWFGFTGRNYVTRSGPQMAALKAMIDRIARYKLAYHPVDR